MSTRPETNTMTVTSLSDLESNYERLLDWAKSHTELGLGLSTTEGTSPEDAAQLRKRLVQSMELGREIVIRCLHSTSYPYPSSSPSTEESRRAPLIGARTSSTRDHILPLSGSLRFGGEPSTGGALRPLPLPEELSSRRVLAPSKSYSKKKSF